VGELVQNNEKIGTQRPASRRDVCLSLKISPKPNQSAHSCMKNGPKPSENSFVIHCFGAFGHPQIDPKGKQRPESDGMYGPIA
jgi:hypothetical protein